MEGADADDLVNITFDLKFDAVKANQLGSTIYRNDTRDSDTRSDVAGREGHLLWGGTYTMHIACRKKKLRFGIFDGKAACLVVFDMVFTTSLTRSVYKSAMVQIAFDDCERAELISNGEEEEDIPDEVINARPQVLKFQPSMFVGDKDRRENPGRFGGEFGATGPSGIGSLKVTAEKDAVDKSIKEGNDKITGVLRVKDSVLQLSINDNKLVDRAMIENFSVPVIVTYKPNRKFQARIRAEADLEWHAWVKPAFGRKDDPVLFDPGRLRGEKLRNGDSVDIDLNTAVDLEDLTRLKQYGGVFHPSPLE
ncbi:hypothetical protein N7G274_003266 [Stereocaulon virgatum]|uniref:Uncharacterized protein n=1 Tax=Stereocaulon virgatum TaxID=373712 RepID=A0ABR4AD55_9LECA